MGDQQPSPKVAKTSPDQDTSSSTASKNKWKDMLLNFLHTLNLLIGMCENALNTKEDIETPAESGTAATNAAETTGNESTSVSGASKQTGNSSNDNDHSKDKIESSESENHLQDEAEENITSSN